MKKYNEIEKYINNKKIINNGITARKIGNKSIKILKKHFKSIINNDYITDVMFLNSSLKSVIGIIGINKKLPIISQFFKNSKIRQFLEIEYNTSLLFQIKNKIVLIGINSNKNKFSIPIPDNIQKILQKIIKKSNEGSGKLKTNGDHSVSLTSPNPGPHFNINLLIGNRINYENSIQTTPKSVIDKLGGGSFRSHAYTQVLAARWDHRQEENGFPANRQFYLLEENKIIFYSYNPNSSNIKKTKCIHSQNYTKIKYTTNCGLKINRLIFILPQIKNFPIATEVQKITIKNNKDKDRKLKIVYTGMFGTSKPEALAEDVLYSNIIMQPEIFMSDSKEISAISHDYYNKSLKHEKRFNSLILYENEKPTFPSEFCVDYNEFIGNGSLYKPQGIFHLSNNLSRKGPGFFALSKTFIIKNNENKTICNFTGLVSKIGNKNYCNNNLIQQLHNLIKKFSKKENINKFFNKNKNFIKKFNQFLKIKTNNINFDSYINNNLPFQIFYQTFTSRSFSQTQKAYRELGFREIQDIFASMFYFISIGKDNFVKQLLILWAEQVFEAGYTNHNFYWEGKEAGKWSDDGLWFIQAVHRYLALTNNINFLEKKVKIAGQISKKRTIYDTLNSIINYSLNISCGRHGFPLIDKADWNDCLKVDTDFLTGNEKYSLFKQSKNWNEDKKQLFKYSESIMNAFLLKKALDNMIIITDIADKKEDMNFYKNESKKYLLKIHKYSWKNDFFARILFNKTKNNNNSFLGACKDGFSNNPNIDGSYYLNSFSWSILSNTATEEQIEKMIYIIKKYLNTSSGYKLCTEVDLSKISPETASEEYFPGDRENGGIFKHASMMAVSAMFKAAKSVNNNLLAKKLTKMAYTMIEKVLPYKTMKNPYKYAGNPRFCTQYINSDTGEHVGPLLSGTATWLALSIFDSLGFEFTRNSLKINPILDENVEKIIYILNFKEAVYNIKIKKPKGFYRTKDNNYTIKINNEKAGKETVIDISERENKDILIEFFN